MNHKLQSTTCLILVLGGQTGDSHSRLTYTPQHSSWKPESQHLGLWWRTSGWAVPASALLKCSNADPELIENCLKVWLGIQVLWWNLLTSWIIKMSPNPNQSPLEANCGRRPWICGSDEALLAEILPELEVSPQTLHPEHSMYFPHHRTFWNSVSLHCLSRSLLLFS